MEGRWYSWVYRQNGRKEEPLPGRLETEQGRMILPPLEQADVEAGIWLLPDAGEETRVCRQLKVRMPALEKKGFLQWAVRVLLGRLFTDREEKERFWRAQESGCVEVSLPSVGSIGAGLTGQGATLSRQESEVLTALLCTPDQSGEKAALPVVPGPCTGKEPPYSMQIGNVQEASARMEEASEDAEPALQRFSCLYNDPKTRKQKKLWMDYFMSPEFFQAWRTPAFVHGMLAVVESVGEEPPVSFLRQVCIAYGIRYRQTQQMEEDGSLRYGYEPCLYQGAEFPEVGAVVKLTALGEPIGRLSHLDEQVRAAGFLDYFQLVALNRRSAADGFAVLRADYEKIFSVYDMECLEKPAGGGRRTEYAMLHRDLCALKLLEQYVRQSDTGGEVLELLFRKLDLQHAVDGRQGVWYGSLRLAVLERLPGLLQEEKKSFLVAARAYDGYRTWSFDRQCAEDEEDERRVERLFAFENFRLALQDETFAKETIFPYWLNLHRTEAFLRKLQEFCGAHQETPCCIRIHSLCGELLKAKKVRRESVMEVRPEPALFGADNGLFWWYFLRRAFVRSMEQSDTAGQELADQMEKELPDLQWEENLLGFSAQSGESTLGRLLSIPVGGHFLHIRLYVSYVQYYLDDEPIWRPIFDWESVSRLPDGALFWLLLPVTKAEQTRRQEVEISIRRRLSGLALPGCREERAAALLADYLTPGESVSGNTEIVRREIDGILYRFQAYGDGRLRCFCGRKESRHGAGRYQDIREAVARGMEWLAAMEALRSAVPRLPRKALPDAIHIRRYAASSLVLEGKEMITPENTADWVDAFLTGQAGTPGHIIRLELSWGDRCAQPGTARAADSLVLLEKDGRYLALYFRGRGFLSVYGAMGRRELYRADGNHEMTCFGTQPIPEYFIHESREFLAERIHRLLQEIGGVGEPCLDFPQWSFLPVRTGNASAFQLARRQFGDFEEEAARNNLRETLTIPCRPDWICYLSKQAAEPELLKGTRLFSQLPFIFHDFLDGRIVKMQAGWEEDGRLRCSVLLLQEEGRYLLLYRDHFRNFGEYLVGDRSGYLNAEGKIRRIPFYGRKVEFYLLHDSPQTIRDGLDILLPNIRQAHTVMGKFTEWAHTTDRELAGLPPVWQLPDGIYGI